MKGPFKATDRTNVTKTVMACNTSMYVFPVHLYGGGYPEHALHVKEAKYFEIFWKIWPTRNVTRQIDANGDS
jgi:hypothetical protein